MGIGQPVATCVGDFDTEGAADDVQEQQEVPTGDATVRDRVGGQLGHDVRRRVQRQAPAAELFRGEESGETGAARGGGELHAEVADTAGEFGGFLRHVTQRGGACLL